MQIATDYKAAVPRRPDVPGPRRAGRRRGRRVPLPADPVGVRRLHASARTRTARSTSRTSASTPRAASWPPTFLAEAGGSGILSADVTYDVMITSFGEGKAPFAITGPWAIAQEDTGSPPPACPTRSPRSRPRGRRGAGRVRRRAGVHGLVVLGAEGPGQELRAGLHDPGADPAGDVRGRRAATGADRRLRAGQRRSRRRRLRRGRRRRHPAAGRPGDRHRVRRRGLAEANVLRGADPTTEFTNAADAVRERIGG